MSSTSCTLRYLPKKVRAIIYGEVLEHLFLNRPNWFKPRQRFLRFREDRQPLDVPDLETALVPDRMLYREFVAFAFQSSTVYLEDNIPGTRIIKDYLVYVPPTRPTIRSLPTLIQASIRHVTIEIASYPQANSKGELIASQWVDIRNANPKNGSTQLSQVFQDLRHATKLEKITLQFMIAHHFEQLAKVSFGALTPALSKWVNSFGELDTFEIKALRARDYLGEEGAKRDYMLCEELNEAFDIDSSSVAVPAHWGMLRQWKVSKGNRLVWLYNTQGRRREGFTTPKRARSVSTTPKKKARTTYTPNKERNSAVKVKKEAATPADLKFKQEKFEE